jgi:hypothetical protein
VGIAGMIWPGFVLISSARMTSKSKNLLFAGKARSAKNRWQSQSIFWRRSSENQSVFIGFSLFLSSESPALPGIPS